MASLDNRIRLGDRMNSVVDCRVWGTVPEVSGASASASCWDNSSPDLTTRDVCRAEEDAMGSLAVASGGHLAPEAGR